VNEKSFEKGNRNHRKLILFKKTKWEINIRKKTNLLQLRNLSVAVDGESLF